MDQASKMHEQRLSFINSESVRDAYRYLVRFASELDHFLCYPDMNGAIKSFRYADSKEQPRSHHRYSFITNKNSLLFRFSRLSDEQRKQYVTRLKKLFDDVNVVSKELEVTVRINTVDDAKRIMDYAFVERAFDAFGQKVTGQTQGSNVTPTSQATLLDDVDEINRREIPATKKRVLIDARIGQGKFRKDVLKQWQNRCAVTGSTTQEAIRASHIQPWRDSSDDERLNKNNGLPLIASLDALFDAGLISFDKSGRVMVSSKLNEKEHRIFGLNGQRLWKQPSEETAAYLAIHRLKHGFKK